MSDQLDDDIITSIKQLEKHYGGINANSLRKETSFLTSEYKRWIEHSEFFAFASVGADGLDCSPRGDTNESLIRIIDDNTLYIPDRRGNNRLDTLRNIVSDPRVALLFFVKGVNETVRINGRAQISIDEDLIRSFEFNGTFPKSVIVVKIDAVYFQCARALKRSRLWDGQSYFDVSDVPTAGQMTKSAYMEFDADTYDEELQERQAKTLY